jgi:hypothetical protein
MSKINYQRVILGGLLAGLIIDIVEWLVNGVIFAGDWAAVMSSLNRSVTISPKQLAARNLWGFLAGITMIWLYAAIRPRYGAGAKTAACAGAAMWFMTYALGGAFPAIVHMYPRRLVAMVSLIELAGVLVAALAGAWLYKEPA